MSKRKSLLIMSTLVLGLGWLTYYYKFYQTYKQIDFFVDTSSSLITQIVFTFTYYRDLIFPYLIIGFILLNLNLILLLIVKLMMERQETIKPIGAWILGIMYILAVIPMLCLNFWPVMLLLIVISLVITYILYTTYRRTTGDYFEDYEEDEVIKEAGPFKSEAEAEAETFFETFANHWQPVMSKKGLRLNSHITIEETDNYHLEISVQTEKNNP